MAAKSPLASVKETFGDKKKLVEAVEAFTKDEMWVSRTNEDKGLAHVSNAKLLRLHRIFSDVKARFGTRAKLIDSILELTKRAKDEGYKSALAKFPVPRLYDLYRSTSKRAGGEKAPSPAAAQKPAAGGEAEKKASAAPKKAAVAAKSAEAAPKKAAGAAAAKEPAAAAKKAAAAPKKASAKKA